MTIRAEFVVLASTCLQPGSVVRQSWFIGNATQWKAEREFGHARAFVEALIRDSSPQAVSREGQALMNPAQPGRGLAVRASARYVPPRNSKKTPGTMTKEFSEITFAPAADLNADAGAIRSRREQIDVIVRQLEAEDAAQAAQQAPQWGAPQQPFQGQPQAWGAPQQPAPQQPAWGGQPQYQQQPAPQYPQQPAPAPYPAPGWAQQPALPPQAQPAPSWGAPPAQQPAPAAPAQPWPQYPVPGTPGGWPPAGQ